MGWFGVLPEDNREIMQEFKQRHEGICLETWKECLGSGDEDLERESPGGEGTHPGYEIGRAHV